jgi:hypothetical protein
LGLCPGPLAKHASPVVVFMVCVAHPSILNHTGAAVKIKQSQI